MLNWLAVFDIFLHGHRLVSNCVQAKLDWPAQRGWVRQWQPGQTTRCELWLNPERRHVETPSGRQTSPQSNSSDSDLRTNYSTFLKSPCLRSHGYKCLFTTCAWWQRKYNPLSAEVFFFFVLFVAALFSLFLLLPPCGVPGWFITATGYSTNLLSVLGEILCKRSFLNYM